MKNLFKFLMMFLATGLVTTSCSDDDTDDFLDNPTPLGAYEEGVLISGEGSTLSGSISYLSNDLTTLENDIYYNVNGEDLGNYLQSVGFDDDYAYIVVDATNSITVVDRYTFEHVATINTGLQNPRFIDFENGKGYVSNWGDPNNSSDDFVAVLDLNNFSVIHSIAVAEGPEQVLAEDGQVFVSHKGGYNVNNIISVIDAANDNLLSTISVNDVPDEMIINDSNELVVLSEGANQWWLSPPVVTSASITKINRSNLTVINSFEFDEGIHPSLMDYEDGMLYFVSDNAVYSMADSATELPVNSMMSLSASYVYGFAVEDQRMYVCDASFTELSTLFVYDLASQNELETFQVAQGASKVYFND